EGLGGQIQIDSKVGEGSTFWFTARFEKPKTAAAKHVLSRRPLQGVRVLIVDDNAVNRRVAEQYVVSWGMRPDCASSAREALQLLDCQRATDGYLVGLLALQMPEMDGIALAREIRRDPRWKDLKLALLTSIGDLATYRSLQPSLFCGCLTKPITKAQLYECLAKMVSEDEAPAPLSSSRSREATADRSQGGAVSLARLARILLAEDNAVNQRV